MSGCPVIDPHGGVISGVLDAVDCHTRAFAESGYDQLTSPSSPFQVWLTVLLVIYVAVLGYQLLFGAGGARLSDLPMIGLKIGVVLALTANWSLFQTLVFDLASRAPLELAHWATSAAQPGGAALAGGPLRGVQYTYDQLIQSASLLAKAANIAGAAPNTGGAAGAAEALWRASEALFLTTAGLFSAAIVAIGILTAVGPVFVALFLFDATRGLFIGWLRALLAAAIAPLTGWMAASLMLIVVQPNILLLASERRAGHIDVDDATSTAAVIFVFALVQIGLLAAGAAIAFGFRLGQRRTTAPSMAAAPAERDAPAAALVLSRAESLANFLRRSEGAPAASQGAPGPGRAAPGGGSGLAYRAAPASVAALAHAPGPRQGQPARRPNIRSREGFWTGGGR